MIKIIFKHTLTFRDDILSLKTQRHVLVQPTTEKTNEYVVLPCFFHQAKGHKSGK
jgi:hypothetical protein